MSDLPCQRCGSPALVIYEQESLCGPCAVEALDERHRYLVVKVGAGVSEEDEEPNAEPTD